MLGNESGKEGREGIQGRELREELEISDEAELPTDRELTNWRAQSDHTEVTASWDEKRSVLSIGQHLFVSVG